MFDTARSVLDTWLDAVNRVDLEAICGLYASNAILLPTFSGRLRNTNDERADYFQSLADRKGVHVTLDESSLRTYDLGAGWFSAAGLYDWSFEGQAPATSRFSFVFNTNSGTPIVQHHSSVVPDAP